jgi:MFS family permease
VVETLIMTGGFIFAGFGALITYLPLYMKDTFDAPELLIGIVMGARAISGVFMAGGLAWAEARFSQRSLVAVSFIGMALSSGIVPFAPNIWGLLASSIIYGAAFGIVRPMLQLKLLDLSPPDLRTTLSSAGTFALRVGQAVSPVAAGLYLAFGTYDGMYFLFAGIALAFAVYSFWAKCLQPGIRSGVSQIPSP